MRVYTDASHDDGVIGIGYVVRDEIDDVEITGHQFVRGDYTSMEAEYNALMSGIHAASWYGDGVLLIQTDCKPLVEKMEHPKEDDKKWYGMWENFDEIVSTFEQWTLNDVPRHQNSEADRLAREALWMGRRDME